MGSDEGLAADSESDGTEWFFRACLLDDAQGRVLSNTVMQWGYTRLASIAMGFVLRHSIGATWTWKPLYFTTDWGAFDIGPLRITGLWLWLIFAAVALSLATALHLPASSTYPAADMIAYNFLKLQIYYCLYHSLPLHSE